MKKILFSKKKLIILAYYTGSVYIASRHCYIIHDNTYNQLIQVVKKNQVHKSFIIVKNLSPVTITSSSLKKNLAEDAIFLNQTNCVKVYGLDDPEYLQFKIGFITKGNISDFALVEEEQLVTLTYSGLLSVYQYDLRKEESNILAQYEISSENSISRSNPIEDQDFGVNFHMMTYSPSSQVLLVGARNEKKLLHHEFHIFKLDGSYTKPQLVLLHTTANFAQPRKGYFRVLGYFGLFEKNPVFFGIELCNDRTKLHSFCYNEEKGELEEFKESKYIDLGLCECVCFGEKFYWAIDEKGSTARIGLNYC